MKRMLAIGLMAVLAIPLGPPVEASPRDVARAACEDAVVAKLRSNRGVYHRISFSDTRVRQVSNAENGVSGKGSYPDHRFSFECIYNIRNGRTSNVSIRRAGGKPDKVTAGDVAGALIGAAIAGAIINSIDKNGNTNNQSRDDGWWSPEQGVHCNSYQSYCTKDGRYSGRWTQRIYGG